MMPRRSPIALLVCCLVSCGEDEPFAEPTLAPLPGPTPAKAKVELLFPTKSKPSVTFEDCVFASPLAFQDDGQTHILVAGGDRIVALDPESGAENFHVELPAPNGERAFVVSTPVIVGERLVVAYHTTAEGSETKNPGRDLMDPRQSQRVAVVHLGERKVDPEFGNLVLGAMVPAAEPGQTVEFRPDRSLQRGTLVHVPEATTLGTVVVTYGNARDLQPWHGWSFEISLSSWSSEGPEEAVSKVHVITPEHDCGPEGASGSRTRVCGGGLWAPSGPLLIDGASGPELILAPGNGQLDLARGDLANTLIRVQPGQDIAPGCNPQACAGFDPDEPSLACAESCTNVFIPRVPAGDAPLRPASGVCDGLGLLPCWEKLDYVGGSTPVLGTTPAGKRVLLHPTKEGHVFLVDADHLGTLHQRKKLVEVCGTKTDPCQADWAGMIVTQPTLAHVAGETLFVVPTFMPDDTHSAGVFGLALRDGEAGPELETRWVFPAPNSAEAKRRFRWHTSRATVVPLAGHDTLWLVEPGTVLKTRGRLLGLLAKSGALLADTPLVGRGFRFTAPLHHGDTLYVPSCDSDRGTGSLEGYRLSVSP